MVIIWTDAESKRKKKVAEITQALSVTPVDVAALRRMAISEGGLLTDEIRCKVWPWLLNVHLDNMPEQLGESGTSCCISWQCRDIGIRS